MHMPSSRPRLWVLLIGIALFALSGWAAADPPSRAARLGYMSGAVSFSPAGENDWVQATQNRPLTSGDRLWADTDSRAEMQVGGAALRMGASTSVTLLNLDDSIGQVQLNQGVLKIGVRRLGPGQIYEVDTPNLAFTLRRPGEYRIEVDPAGDATAVMVRRGQGEVYGDGASYVVDSGQGYRFTGTGLRDYEDIGAAQDDDFDRWASERDRRNDNSASARYVSSDVVGYEDLDSNGTWRRDPDYGNVWVPNRVAADWTPYHEGHWAWVDPWGWTWVDDAPWGYAVSHYGRWANLRGTWGWVPGPVAARAVYAPALVAFVGGSNFQLSISLGSGGAVGWFPLAPRDVYRPSYAASRGYFDNINRSNTVINTTTITNVYNTTNVTNIVYANRQVRGAVVAVPTTAFVRAQPVAKAAVPVSKDAIVRAPVSAVAAVAPVQQSVHGAAAPGAKPPTREHAIVARSAPPAAPVGLAAQQQQLAARPGRPLDEAARKELKPVTPVAAPKVSVVATAQAKPPTAAPPARSRDGGGKPEQAKAPVAAPAAGAPALPQQSAVLPKVAPPPVTPPAAGPSAAVTQPPQQAARPGQRDQVVTPAAPPRVERPPVASPPISPPPAGPAVAARQPPPQAATPAQRDQVVTPAAPPRVERPPVASPPISPPPAGPAVAARQPPPQAARPAQRDQVVTPAAPPRVERPPVASPPISPPPASPSAAVAQPPQRARPEPPVQAIARPAPPLVMQPQVRPPPIVMAPVPLPAPIAQAPQRARPEPRVQPVAPAPQVAPAPSVRPPAPAAQPSPPQQRQPSPAAQPPAPKPAPDASKSAEQKKAEEENQRRKP
jgi:hypothetical protein